MSEEIQNDSIESVETETLDSQLEELSGDSSLDDEELSVDDEGGEEASAEEIQEEIKRLKKLKIKYNGKEYEEELPFEIDDNPEVVEYMKKQLQMAKMSQSKAQELSNMQKEVEAFINELRKNPRKILSNPDIGVDVKELVNEILQEEIENSQKSS